MREKVQLENQKSLELKRTTLLSRPKFPDLPLKMNEIETLKEMKRRKDVKMKRTMKKKQFMSTMMIMRINRMKYLLKFIPSLKKTPSKRKTTAFTIKGTLTVRKMKGWRIKLCLPRALK